MQTRQYKDLFKLISALVGTGGQLATGEQDQLRHFINRRFQEAFDESPIWPRYIVSSEERQIIALTLSGATSSTSTSVNQDYKLLGSNTTGGTNVYQGTTTNTVIIYNTGSAWRVDTSASAAEQADGTYTVSAGTQQFIEADTNKKNNVKDVETWTPRSGSDVLSVVAKQLIPYAETNKTTIGDFNRIHRKKAFLNNSAIEYEFFVDFDGANILNIVNTTDNTAFVTYKKQFTPFTVTSGYYDSSVEVPGEFFNFIAHASYADFLRVQNKQEEAIAEENLAKTYLALELEKIDIRSNNNTINKRFSTYVSRQSR
jgi:archaellum component FlaG (FlaF/FlaG flagellin family)